MKIRDLIYQLQLAKQELGDLTLVVMEEPEVYSIVEKILINDKSSDMERAYSKLPDGNYAHIVELTKDDMDV